METVSIYDMSAAKRKVKKEQRAWKYLREVCSLNSSDLNKLAVIDGGRKYTYGQMFREWERYASVFTALDMTEEHNARVGVLGSTCSEVIFAFYGLNMVGAQVSLVASWSAFNFTRIEETILQEKLTDFIITDDLAQIDLVRELDTCLPYEVPREKEFAPIKNKTGIDSVESARELCKLNGIEL